MTTFEEHISNLLNAGGIDDASVVGPRCVCPACRTRWPSRHNPGPSADTAEDTYPES
jgi:hypothetical protein